MSYFVASSWYVGTIAGVLGYPEKVVTLEGELLARLRPTLKKPWGEVVLADEK